MTRRGEGEVLVEHYRKLGTPTADETFDADFEMGINAWAEANLTCTRKGRHWFRRVVQREFTREEVKKCVLILRIKDRKTAGADQIVNEFLNFRGQGMRTMMVMLRNWIWKNKHAPRRPRGVVVKLFEERRYLVRLIRVTIEG